MSAKVMPMQEHMIHSVLGAVNQNGSVTSGYVDCKDYERVTFVLAFGASVTDNIDVRVLQATDSSGTGAKIAPLDKDKAVQAITTDSTRTDIAASSDVVDLGTTLDNKYFVVSVEVTNMDFENSFRYLALQVGVGTNPATGDLLSVLAICTGARRKGDNLLPDVV